MKAFLFPVEVALYTILTLAAYLVIYIAVFLAVGLLTGNYLPYNNFDNTDTVLIVLLLFDRFFGPQGKTIRSVGKTLEAARRRKKHG